MILLSSSWCVVNETLCCCGGCCCMLFALGQLSFNNKAASWCCSLISKDSTDRDLSIWLLSPWLHLLLYSKTSCRWWLVLLRVTVVMSWRWCKESKDPVDKGLAFLSWLSWLLSLSRLPSMFSSSFGWLVTAAREHV